MKKWWEFSIGEITFLAKIAYSTIHGLSVCRDVLTWGGHIFSQVRSSYRCTFNTCIASRSMGSREVEASDDIWTLGMRGRSYLVTFEICDVLTVFLTKSEGK